MWEYLRLYNPTPADLYFAGTKGWELVSAYAFETGGSLPLVNVASYKVHQCYVFKRRADAPIKVMGPLTTENGQYVCSECGSYVRADAVSCKSCKKEYGSVE